MSKALLENRNVETVVAFERTAKYQDELQVSRGCGSVVHRGGVTQTAVSPGLIARLLRPASVSSHNTKDLVTNSAGRFAHVALDPFWWDSFSVTKERGLLDRVETLPWEESERDRWPLCRVEDAVTAAY